MSDNAIRIGDLVYVSGGCHCHDGFTFTVLGFVDWDAPDWLLICDSPRKHYVSYRGRFAKSGKRAIPLPWLRRIPPLAELDEAERKEEISTC